jgi:hypothetical protein
LDLILGDKLAVVRLNDHVELDSYLCHRCYTWVCGILLIYTNLAARVFFMWKSFSFSEAIMVLLFIFNVAAGSTYILWYITMYITRTLCGGKFVIGLSVNHF